MKSEQMDMMIRRIADFHAPVAPLFCKIYNTVFTKVCLLDDILYVKVKEPEVEVTTKLLMNLAPSFF